uniref:Uncharacterized protein n=1 Tax=Mola mola TaxID=94237 RepID=A0A3Q3VZH2_MOLML
VIYTLDNEYSVPLERIAETQLILCNPERELLPLVLAHCHYTLKKGGETDSSYDLPGIQIQLARRFLAGKPLIQDTSRYLNRHLAVRTLLRSYTDVCDAVFVLEIGLRFLAKTGGDPQGQLLSYLSDSLQMDSQISSSVAKVETSKPTAISVIALLCQECGCHFKGSRLPSDFQKKLSEDQRRGLRGFLAVTDVDAFALELHEVLLLKTSNAVADEGYQPQWESTLELHLDQKDLPPLLGLDSLSEDITLGQATDVWRAAVEFKRR